MLKRDHHIDVVINIQSEASKKTYFARLNASVNTTKLLLKQGFPSRGHDESKKSYNKDIFLEIRDFFADYDPFVGKAMRKILQRML